MNSYYQSNRLKKCNYNSNKLRYNNYNGIFRIKKVLQIINNNKI